MQQPKPNKFGKHAVHSYLDVLFNGLNEINALWILILQQIDSGGTFHNGASDKRVGLIILIPFA
jgi:hypothetical protein